MPFRKSLYLEDLCLSKDCVLLRASAVGELYHLGRRSEEKNTSIRLRADLAKNCDFSKNIRAEPRRDSASKRTPGTHLLMRG